MLTEFAAQLELDFLNLSEAITSTIEPAATDGMNWHDALSLAVGAEPAHKFEVAASCFTLVHDEVLRESNLRFAMSHREKLTEAIDVMMTILLRAADQKPGVFSAETLDTVRSNLRFAQKYVKQLKAQLQSIDPLSVSLHRHFGMLTPWSVRNFSFRTRDRQHAYREPILALANARDVVLASRTVERLDAYLELVPAVVDALLLEEIIDDRKEDSFREALTAAADELQVTLLMETEVLL